MTQQEQIRELENIIARDIHACQSSLIEEALRTKLFSSDDIENSYRPFDGKLLKPTTCVKCSNDVPFRDSETGECEACYENYQRPQEIYEWWLVSPWLAKKLIIEGVPVLENNYGTWWGRCTTGQAIVLDDVIQRIYECLMT